MLQYEELRLALLEQEAPLKELKEALSIDALKAEIGELDKMTAELEADIKAFLGDRSIKQVDLMEKHKISRNTLKKYIELVKENS